MLVAMVVFVNRRFRPVRARDRLTPNYDLITAAWRLELERHPQRRTSFIMNAYGREAFSRRAAEVYDQFVRDHWREPTVEELLYQISVRRPREHR